MCACNTHTHIYTHIYTHKHTYIHTKQGESPLIIASAGGNLFDMQLLLAAGCEVDACAKHDQITALMAASSVGFLECVKFLIERGADVSVKDKVFIHV
jgi:ankyrin repeat protein